MTPVRRLTDQPHAGRCAQCASPLAHDQCYCVDCGTRRGPLPARDRGDRAARRRHVPAGAPLAAAADPHDPPEEPQRLGALAAAPRVASLAVMAMLTFGVIAGSLTGPGGGRAWRPPVVRRRRGADPPGIGTGGGGGSSGGSGPATITADPRPACPPRRRRRRDARPARPPAQARPVQVRPRPSPADQARLPDRADGAELQPVVRHEPAHPYLASTLPRQGELIPATSGSPSPRWRAGSP